MLELFPLAAFLGLLIGVLLAFIAPEELSSGKRFFELTRKILLILLFASLAYGLRRDSLFFFLAAILGLIIVVVNVRWPRLWIEIINYGLVFTFSIFLVEQRLLTATMLFLYSLPVGTLVRMAYQKQKG